MGCCKCLGGIFCILILAAAGVCTWRFGPWYNNGNDGTDTSSSTPDLKARNTCDSCCNGLTSACSLPINEVIIPMVHNAHSSKSDLFAGYNNNKPLEDALVAGFRGLMLDSCICDGSIGETIQNWVKGEDKGENYLGFCHTSCDAGVRDPAEVLGNIKTFLDINRNEVLMIEFEINDNSLEQLYYAIDESGLDQYVYRASNTNEWPTMQQLIDDDLRLLLFAHGDGMKSCYNTDCPEGIFYTYDHMEQTDWNDDTCAIKNEKDYDYPFFLMNHWKNNDYDLPSERNAEDFNTYNALVERFRTCEDKIPNVIGVDFWDVGDVLKFAYDVNRNQIGASVSQSSARSQTVDEGGV